MFQRLAQAFHVPVPAPVPIQEIERRPAVGTRGRASMASTAPMAPMAPMASTAPAASAAPAPAEPVSFSDQRKSFIKEEEAKRKLLWETAAVLPRSTYDPRSMALTGFSDTHQEGHRDGNVIKIYQRATRPPFQKNLLQQGPVTVEQVLQEAPVTDRPIDQLEQGRPLQTPLTRVPYRMCSDMPDQILDMGCLQSLFLEMGGKPAGSMYPSEQNMVWYHTMGTIGAVRQRWTHTLSQMKHPDPTVQQEAILCMLGALPEAKRAPYHPGVEAFWFVKDAGRIVGFLGRTIETDIASHRIMGTESEGEAVLYVTDLRVKQPVSAICRITSNGFWLFLNQPTLMDYTASRHLTDRIPVNLPGLLLDFHETETRLSIGTGPQLMKFYGSPSDTLSLVGSKDITYSLACDTRDPILAFEVDPVNRTFQELRNPGLFSFCSMRSLEMYTRTEERMSVPEQKGFARMNSSQSGIHLPTIHAGSWRTLTIAFRMISMPIKETLFHIMGQDAFFSIVLTTINGSTAEMRLEESKQGKTRVIPTPYRLGVNHWYTVVIQQTEGMRVQLVPYGQPALPPVYIVRQDSLFGKGLCNLSLGTQGTKAMSTTSFQYDVAWIHLYDYLVEARSAPTPPWGHFAPPYPPPVKWA